MSWRSEYPKSRRPVLSDFEQYLDGNAFELFRTFTGHLSDELKLTYIKPKYLKAEGWVLDIGRSGLTMIRNVRFANGQFHVNGTEISDQRALDEALQWATRVYGETFEAACRAHSEKQVQRQKERNERKKKREKASLDALEDEIDKGKFNRFKWSPRVSRAQIKKLYDRDAEGLQDVDLVDEVGFCLYARCLQGRDERRLMEDRKIKCHHCGSILNASRGLVECACGYQYLYRDYRRSFRSNNMPSGAATPIFNRFIEKWSRARVYAEKMRLIDWLIHEFHASLITGAKGRFVGINLISGTKAQIAELISELAYGGKKMET